MLMLTLFLYIWKLLFFSLQIMFTFSTPQIS